MILRKIFISNLKEFRKKEGLTQMKLAELCNTSCGYIGEIEIGRKFPSAEMIERFAQILRIEPYHLFKNNTDTPRSAADNPYPLLPKSMKTEIHTKIATLVHEVLAAY